LGWDDHAVSFREGRVRIVIYVAKTEKPGVILQLRRINEFEVTDLMKGNTLMLGFTLKMK
jgi:hypothetical protein